MVSRAPRQERIRLHRLPCLQEADGVAAVLELEGPGRRRKLFDARVCPMAIVNVPRIALQKRRGKWRYVVIDQPGASVMDWAAATRVAKAKGNIRAAHASMRSDFPGWKPRGVVA